MSLQNRRLRAATWSFVAVLAAGLFVIVFQTQIRYRYETIGGIRWRVDQITDQRCRVLETGVMCGPDLSTSVSQSPSKSKSKSKSVSISTSTSTSLR